MAWNAKDFSIARQREVTQKTSVQHATMDMKALMVCANHAMELSMGLMEPAQRFQTAKQEIHREHT